MAWNEKLRLALAAKGIGSPQLAPMLDVSENTARNYLSARTHPDIDVFWRICQIAEVSAEWVLDDKQPARLVPAGSQPASFTVTANTPEISRPQAPAPKAKRKRAL